MAKLLPTQWRTIAPIVGRTATQCLERYQKLLDEQEARESGDLGLAGPDGGEAAAPSAEDVRRLRPGEVDAYAESRPARPDAVDLEDEDKEMLSYVIHGPPCMFTRTDHIVTEKRVRVCPTSAVRRPSERLANANSRNQEGLLCSRSAAS